MSYRVLARKWRPRTFDAVVGQEHVVRALRNALALDRIHHAYLFAGTRGVGKTTLARILAKCLNCETAVTAEPCGQCSACTQIDRGRFVDLIEVDAASRTGIDDTRELLDNVQYLPVAGRCKIYLIDEVHMLSTSSFNALLKTLEEPPAHVKFFFATTHPQKLPVTILSRCLQFNLTRIHFAQLQQHLTQLLESEAVSFDAAAVHQIVLSAEGSVRDALSLLDQAIAYGNGALRLDEVETMLGIAARHHVTELLQHVALGKAGDLLQKITALYARAVDFENLLGDIIALLHEIAVYQAVSITDVSGRFKPEDVIALARITTPEDVQLFYQIALHGKRDLPVLPSPRDAFEMTLLRMLGFKPLSRGDHSVDTQGASAARQVPPPGSRMAPTASDSRRVPDTPGRGDHSVDTQGASAARQVPPPGSRMAPTASDSRRVPDTPGRGDHSVDTQGASAARQVPPPGSRLAPTASDSRRAPDTPGRGNHSVDTQGASAARQVPPPGSRMAPTASDSRRVPGTPGRGDHSVDTQGASAARQVPPPGSRMAPTASDSRRVPDTPGRGDHSVDTQGASAARQVPPPGSRMALTASDSRRAPDTPGRGDHSVDTQGTSAARQVPPPGSRTAPTASDSRRAPDRPGRGGPAAAVRAVAVAVPEHELVQANATSGTPAQMARFTCVEGWIALIDQLGLHHATRELCYGAVFSCTAPAAVCLTVDPAYAMLRSSEREAEIARAFEKFFRKKITVCFRVAASDEEVPAQWCQRREHEKKTALQKLLESNPHVQELRAQMGATIVPDSVRPRRPETD